MNYSQSIRYLDSFFDFEKIPLSARSQWNLARMRFLFRLAGRPEKDFFPVVIAGTKGKGSTGFFLESILCESGIPAGFYSSPHLEDPRERIRIRGRKVSKRDWAAGVTAIRNILRRAKAPPGTGTFTYFEIVTLLAALLFKKAGVRAGIFEVGMGGRLDAANAVNAKLCILTPIHFDHEAFLGNTLAEIAREKAAIVKNGADAVISPQYPEASAEIRKSLKRRKATGWQIPAKKAVDGVGLAGKFQEINAAAAVQAAEILRDKHGFPVTPEGVQRGIGRRDWPGRLEFFAGRPDCLLDAAHNPMSARAVAAHLKEVYSAKKRVLIFACSRDKKSEKMLRTFAAFFDEVFLTVTGNPRSKEIGVLAAEACGYYRRIFLSAGPEEAFDWACRRAGKNGLVVVTGSFYLVGRLRSLAKKKAAKTSMPRNGRDRV